jgi:hypothetical protein
MSIESDDDYYERKVLGKCTRCGEQPCEDALMCPKHRKMHNENSKSSARKIRKKRLNYGLCAICGKRPLITSFHCYDCLIKLRNRKTLESQREKQPKEVTKKL